MAKTCPKCGDPNGLDYDPFSKKWKCVWVDCDYEEPNQDKNPVKKLLWKTNRNR